VVSVIIVIIGSVVNFLIWKRNQREYDTVITKIY
jgi:hypothetical protein